MENSNFIANNNMEVSVYKVMNHILETSFTPRIEQIVTDVLENNLKKHEQTIDTKIDTMKNQFQSPFHKDKIGWNAYTKNKIKEFGLDGKVVPDMIRGNILTAYSLKSYEGFTNLQFENIKKDRDWENITNNQVLEKLILEQVSDFYNAFNNKGR